MFRFDSPAPHRRHGSRARSVSRTKVTDAAADSAILQFQNLMGAVPRNADRGDDRIFASDVGSADAGNPNDRCTCAPVAPTVPPLRRSRRGRSSQRRPARRDSRRIPAEQRDLRGDLLRIVAARTGYPVEILALDAAMEADLGIDSIKKVEILAEFRRQFSASEQDRIRAVMEKLTSASTLGQILDRVTAAIGEPVRERNSSSGRRPPRLHTTRDFAADLLRIVAARTGYPIEMLALDAAIEADLGIDSIKKVEILAEFRRQFSASEQESLRAVMDKLTSAQTFHQILEQVRIAFGTHATAAMSQAVPAVQPVAAAPSVDIAGTLLRIASARTGYPADMLAMDADLEADLGIDSIKRVEIIGELRRSLPERTRN